MKKSNPEIYFTNGIQYFFEEEPKIKEPINNIEQIILSTNPELELKQKYRWAGHDIISKTKPCDEKNWKKPLPLQAADLVAFEWRKDQMNTTSPNSSEHVPARFPLLALLHGIGRRQYWKGLNMFSFGVFGQEQISELREFAKSVLMEDYNFIADRMIGDPRLVTETYQRLPENIRNRIKDRDSQSS